MSWKPIVGRQFTADAFDAYVKGLVFTTWRPRFVVVHNTGVPTKAQRPNGFSPQQIQNLVSYYRDTMHWSAGPHCFVDQNGVWAFTPLTETGVHSPSWNAISWGVETLGDYMVEDFNDPIHANLVACLATLHATAGLDPTTLRFHKEDPKTTHKDCPGVHIVKSQLIADVQALIAQRFPGDHPAKGLPLADGSAGSA